MSVKSQLEKAETAVRQALIAALAEGEDEYLTELFDALNTVGDLKKKVSNTIRFADNTKNYYSKLDDPNFSDYSFELFSDKNGKDLDVLDNLIPFPSGMSDDDKPGLTD
tara:strand:+ start:295 stop:621 length:327 start_codon:yes stop_codon:yes gene_type:complete